MTPEQIQQIADKHGIDIFYALFNEAAFSYNERKAPELRPNVYRVGLVSHTNPTNKKSGLLNPIRC